MFGLLNEDLRIILNKSDHKFKSLAIRNFDASANIKIS